MSGWNEWSLAAIAWLGNLILFGSVITGTTAIVLRLTLPAAPRTRYFIALIAFFGAILLPGALQSYDRHHAGAAPEAMIALAPNSHPATERATSRAALERAHFPIPPAGGRFAWGFLVVWALVATALLSRELVGHWEIGKQRRQWAPATRELRDRLQCPGTVNLSVHESDGPSTSGLLRPGVVLPLPLIELMETQELRRILMHENDHLRWRDPLVNALVRIATLALWPAPPLWFLRRMIHVEREAAADQAAIGMSPHDEVAKATVAYAQSLISVARWRRGLSGQAARGSAIPVGATHCIEKRIERLVRDPAPLTRTRLASAAIVAIACLGTCLMLPMVSVSAGSAQRLFELLHGRDYRVEGDVKSTLADLRREGEMGDVVAALGAPAWETREKAAWILGQIGDRKAVPPLISAWRRDRSESRSTMAWALGTIGDSRAVSALIASVSEPSAEARGMAAWALGNIGDRVAVEPILPLLHDPDATVRHAAAYALGLLGDRRAIEPLRAAVNDSDRLVREAAMTSLRQLGV